MLIAVYGIIGELSNPGAIIPGATGLISLILSLYMASVLPVNVAGLALVGLSIALFIGEAFTPTSGIHGWRPTKIGQPEDKSRIKHALLLEINQ